MRIGVTYEVKGDAPMSQFVSGGAWDRDSELLSAAALAEIVDALEQCGHDIVHLHSAESLIRRAREGNIEVDLCVNLSVGYGGPSTKVYTAVLLELLGIEYVGSPSYALVVSREKTLMKSVVHSEGIPTPRWLRFAPGDSPTVGDRLSFPVIIKPVHESCSIGITTDSLARLEAEVEPAVRMVWSQYGQAALVEEYVPGIDIEVPLMGYPVLQAQGCVAVLPPTSAGSLDILTSEIVYNDAYYFSEPREAGVTWGPVQEVKALGWAERLAGLLGMRDYGRIDFRVTREGKLSFLEASTHPYLAKHSGFFFLSEKRGQDYTEFWRNLIGQAAKRVGQPETHRRNPLRATE